MYLNATKKIKYSFGNRGLSVYILNFGYQYD